MVDCEILSILRQRYEHCNAEDYNRMGEEKCEALHEYYKDAAGAWFAKCELQRVSVCEINWQKTLVICLLYSCVCLFRRRSGPYARCQARVYEAEAQTGVGAQAWARWIRYEECRQIQGRR